MTTTSCETAAAEPIPGGGDYPGIDFFAPAFLDDPFPAIRHQQRTEPVWRDEQTGLWVISRYADVRAALLNPATFAADNVLNAVTPLSWAALRVLARAGFDLPPTLANNSGSSHPALRRLVAAHFTRARVDAAIPLVRRLIDQSLDGVAQELATTGECDLATTFTRDVPCLAMLELLEFEPVGTATLSAWTKAALELFWGKPSPADQPALAAQAADLFGWLSDQVAGTERGPHTLIGALSAHRLDGDRALRHTEIVAVCYFMIIASQVTTTQLMNTLFVHLLQDRSRWRELGADPTQISHMVEESLRREPPLSTWRRVVTRPVRIADVDLPAGAEVLLMLAGSGWDESVFPDPERTCPYRPNVRRHLAFGVGSHRCIGAEFARMEAAEMLSAAVSRFPTLRLRAGAAPSFPRLLSFRAPEQVIVEVGQDDTGPSDGQAPAAKVASAG